MDQFGYLSVLLSIIVGLSLTQVLKGFRGIVLARARVKNYWPVMSWAAWLLIANVQSWWTMFQLREVQHWNFVSFFVVLLQTILQYMLAAIVFPDFFGEETIDLRPHYFNHTRWFFGLLTAVLVVSLSKDIVLTYHPTDAANLGFHALFLASSVSALVIQREWYHKAIAIIGPGLFYVYTIALFMRLR
jgi:hypothetical protein